MFSEDDLLPISALQHLAFCERQWGLMYLENIWAENQLTAEGRLLHEKADDQGAEIREGITIARGLRLQSLHLGLVGVADVVEFHPATADNGEASAESKQNRDVRIDGIEGWVTVFPIEFKHGHPKPNHCDLVQLCAQALCLEEMLNTTVSDGAIFYGKPRRRLPVVFDDVLRTETKALITRLHEMTKAAITPKAIYTKRCRSCSIYSYCLPRVTSGNKVQKYLERATEDAQESENLDNEETS